MTVNSRYRMTLSLVGIAGVVVGILSLLGVRPMNSRTIEIVLGSASLVAGLMLLAVTWRPKPAPDRASIA